MAYPRASSAPGGNQQQSMPANRRGKSARQATKPPAHTVMNNTRKNSKGLQKVSGANGRKGSLVDAPSEVVLPSVGVYAADITNAAIAKLPIVAVPVSIELLTSLDAAERAVGNILSGVKNDDVIGFDMEIKPRFVKGEVLQPPSVMQIATRDTLYVFHLKRIGKSSQTSDSKYPVQDFIHAANIVRPLLESASIRAPQGTPETRMFHKCGIGIKDDLAMLKEFGPKLQPKGFVCMHDFAEKAGFRRRSLRVLSAILLGQRLSKKQQMSDWGRPTLTDRQVEYAAADAWASRQVALKLQPLWLPGV